MCVIAGVSVAANDRLVEVDAPGSGPGGSGEVNRNGFEQRFTLFVGLRGLLMEDYEGVFDAAGRTQKIVTRIYGNDVGVKAIDPGKDIEIGASFLKSILEILAEE